MILTKIYRNYEDLIYKSRYEKLFEKLLIMVLKPFELLYSLGFYLSYIKRRICRTLDVPVPVVSIGNINLGGTGKTPLVINLFSLFKNNGFGKIAVISRGYRRKSSGDIILKPGQKGFYLEEIGDEPFMIKNRLPDCIMLVGSNRKKLIQTACGSYGAEAIIMDDSFRHIDINSYSCLAVDGRRGFGNRHLFPAGPLRQPLWTLNKAHCFIISGSEKNPDLELLLKKYDKPIIYADYKVEGISDCRGIRDISLKDMAVLISAIGNNGSFFDTSTSFGIQVAEHITFMDHHRYTENDLQEIKDRTKQLDFGFYLTTEKDYYKLIKLKPAFDKELLFLKISLEFQDKDADRQIFKRIREKCQRV